MNDNDENKAHDLSIDVEEARKKGKGYTTILANIVGDVRKRDIEKAAKLQHKEEKDPGIIKRILKKLGWSDREAATAAEGISGLKKNDLYEEDIVSLENLKEDEIRLTAKRKISGLDKSGVLRFHSKDYFILEIIQQEDKEEATYHLKAC